MPAVLESPQAPEVLADTADLSEGVFGDEYTESLGVLPNSQTQEPAEEPVAKKAPARIGIPPLELAHKFPAIMDKGNVVPPPLRPYTALLVAAAEKKIPARIQQWERLDRSGKSLEKGTNPQEANSRIYTLVNDVITLTHNRRWKKDRHQLTPGEEQKLTAEYQAAMREIEQWNTELTPFLKALAVMEAVTAVYLENAPKRVVRETK